MEIKTGTAGRQLIQSYEKLRLKAYRDLGGVWTNGWGHTGPDVHEGDVWTVEHANAVFEADLLVFEKGVNDLVKVPLSQNQFDALVCFAYNVGLDQDADTKAEGLGDSTLLKKLNAGDYEGAAEEFKKWNKVDGIPARGLTIRRAAETALFRAGTGGEHEAENEIA